MITGSEQKQLKALFQGRYTEGVLKILSNKNICNRNGDPHNAKYIRMVFQGIRKNVDIESAIWELATIRKKELEYQKLQKTKVLY
ncbi:MAG: hypothetical protein ACPG44_08710 [Polaribacter sp.]